MGSVTLPGLRHLQNITDVHRAMHIILVLMILTILVYSIIRKKYCLYTHGHGWMKVNLCRSVRQTAHPVLGHLGLDLFDLEASSQVRNAFRIDSDLCAKHWIRHSNRCAHCWFSLCLASWLCVSSKGVFYISWITFPCWIWLQYDFILLCLFQSLEAKSGMMKSAARPVKGLSMSRVHMKCMGKLLCRWAAWLLHLSHFDVASLCPVEHVFGCH